MLESVTRLATMMDQICPFHLALSAEGDIIGRGPSLAKIAPQFDHVGACSFWTPDGPVTLKTLTQEPTRNLRLHIGAPDDTHFVGQSFPIFGGAWLFIGPTLEEITKWRGSGLRRDDFPAQMLIEDILFLIEAKSVVLAASQDITARLQHEKSRAENRAMRDVLTGLGNRHAYQHLLDTEDTVKMGRCVMQLDLDKFKAVNDNLGHAAGDHVLQHVARLLVDVTRREDEVIRMGGDEFTVVLRGIRQRSDADTIATRLIELAQKPIDFRGQPCQFGVSVGFAWQNDHPELNLSALVERADHALYAAKSAGRGCYKWSTEPKTVGVENGSGLQFLRKPDQYTPCATSTTARG